MSNKRNPNKALLEAIAKVDPETKAMTKRAMTCKWQCCGYCTKALSGTPCEPRGCVAWQKMEE